MSHFHDVDVLVHRDGMPVDNEVLHCRVGSGSAPHPGVTVLPAVGPEGSGAEGCG